MLRVAVGHSDDPDSVSAIAEVLDQCQRSLDGDCPQAGLLFVAVDFDYAAILTAIHEIFPDLELIGGTTDGELSSVLEFQQDSLTLMLFSSDTVEFAVGVGHNLSGDTALATQTAIAQAQAKLTTTPKLCIAVPEGLNIDGSLVVESLQQALANPQIPILGGLAGDQWQFQKTYQFYKTEVLTNSIPVLLFGGNLLCSHGVASGWRPIGRRSRVTKATQNVVYTIDDQPALAYYQEYLGSLEPATEYPLAIFEGNDSQFYLRAPLTYDAETGSIMFAGKIPEQAWVELAEASQDAILAASQQSIEQAFEQYSGTTPDAALLFSCCGRRQILGTHTAKEYQYLPKHLQTTIPTCGFYTYGEISPLQLQGKTYVHNETFVTCLLGTSA